MRIVKTLIRVFLSSIQAVALAAPFVLHYFGSHTMGAHRHLKVRSDVYLSGILNSTNLTIAAVFVAVIIVLLLGLWILAGIHRPRPNKLWSIMLSFLFSLVLFLILTLPAVKSLLIFPWLLLCAALVWILQLAKMLLLDRRTFSAIVSTCGSFSKHTASAQ